MWGTIALCLSSTRTIPPASATDLTVNPLFTQEPLAVSHDRLPDTGMDAELVGAVVTTG
jgi:hypothetical protein